MVNAEYIKGFEEWLCNDCGWRGTEEQLCYNDLGDAECPTCGNDNVIMVEE